MKFDIITLFPEIFTPLEHSIIGRAKDKGVLDIKLHQLRDYAINDYGQVDDEAYGGEAGMVMRCEPIYNNLKAIDADQKQCPVIFLTPQGKPFKQADAKILAKEKRIVMICGHYKGIDERIRENYVTHEYSLGDFVITGGELAAMVMVDAISRLLPNAMNNRESAENDSHYDGKLSWPIYTRPEIFMEKKVPSILLSGHHANIKKWQEEQSLKRTKEKRPDLFDKLD